MSFTNGFSNLPSGLGMSGLGLNLGIGFNNHNHRPNINNNNNSTGFGIINSLLPTLIHSSTSTSLYCL